MMRVALIVGLAAGVSFAGPGEAIEPTSAQVREAVDRGIDYLLRDQNAPPPILRSWTIVALRQRCR